jgi:hypothetical protein
MLMRAIQVALCVSCLLSPRAVRAGETPLTPAEQTEIAREAYVYLYPLLTMDVTRRISTNEEAGKSTMRGPANAFLHLPAFPPADFRDVVRPNFDTLYSIAFVDLTSGPMVVSAPDTGGRYYLLPMLDMWTDVFASPGKRTTGTGAASWALTPPGWKGDLPASVSQIAAPTPWVWIIGRTQTNGPADYDAVHKVQAGFKLAPLAEMGKEWQPPAVKVDPSVDMKTPPIRQVTAMPAARYFSYGAELMKVNPPHATDQAILARMKRLGIEAGKSFDFAKAEPAVQRALSQGVADGQRMLELGSKSLGRTVNHWQIDTDTMGVYGNSYLRRAVIAMFGLGANQPEDAVYPFNAGDSDGKPLDGSHKYVLHFAKADLPPVSAFWSVTLYDPQGFPVANPLNRFAIGDRDSLTYNKDGSLDLYFQNASPGKDKESNWLPSPKGAFTLTMRMYAPKAEVLDGRWAPPAVKRAK